MIRLRQYFRDLKNYKRRGGKEMLRFTTMGDDLNIDHKIIYVPLDKPRLRDYIGFRRKKGRK